MMLNKEVLQKSFFAYPLPGWTTIALGEEVISSVNKTATLVPFSSDTRMFLAPSSTAESRVVQYNFLEV